MELRHLRYFIRAAELMNFTKAAESLYVSQPTLSVQIHQLEEELGTELFSRVGRNIRLTEPGRAFLARARRAVQELEDGGKEIDAIKGVLRGSLSIASLPLYGSRIMTAWVAAFYALHPGVYIRVKAGPSEDIETGILDGDIDLGFTLLPKLHQELESAELFKDEIVLVASQEHKLAKKKSLKISDLEKLSIALPSERISTSRILSLYLEEHGIQPAVGVSFDDGHALVELIRKTDFVTFLPRLAVKDQAGICMLQLPPPGMAVTTGAVWSHLSPAARTFLDLMKQQAEQTDFSQPLLP
jgi:LysR family cyn operon transcriptional activator